MDLHTLVLFTVACLSINLIPGPDVIYIVSNTMKGKMASGMKAALGVHESIESIGQPFADHNKINTLRYKVDGYPDLFPLHERIYT